MANEINEILRILIENKEENFSISFEDLKIVDYGCGELKLAHRLKDKFKKVYGYDSKSPKNPKKYVSLLKAI